MHTDTVADRCSECRENFPVPTAAPDNVVNAPGFWDLMKHLAQIATNEDGWHEFSISFRCDGDTVWVGDAHFGRRPLPVTGPTIKTSIGDS